MSNITSKILGLGSLAIVFAGMSFGQTITCGAPVVSNVILDRVEDTTALVGDIGWTCTNGAVAIVGATAMVSVDETVTSKVLSAATGQTEAVLIINDTTTPADSTVVLGVVSGSTITFGANTLLGTINFAAGDNFTMRIANVRVNSSLAAPNYLITESLTVDSQGVAAFSSGSPTVGVVIQGFGKPSVVANSVVNYPLCTANAITAANPAAGSFSVSVAENTTAMFKSQVPVATCGPNGTAACTITNAEQGSYVGNFGNGTIVAGFNSLQTSGGGNAGGLSGGDATHGTRFLFSFAGIPTGATVYVPTTITSINANNSKLVLTLTASATGALAPPTPTLPSTHGPFLNGYTSLTATGGAASAVYEVTTTDNLSIESFTLAGSVVAAANFASTAQPAITVTVTPAPSAGTDIPTFAASSNTALNLSAFTVCQTTLLFPFVAAGGGFDTGIAIANTGLDPYAAGLTAGGNSGSCTFNFYGTGAPSPSTGVSLPAAAFPSPLAPGQIGSFSLAGSSVAPNFVGYMIAQCSFVYAHGFGYISYNQGQPSADAQGYLAEVLGANRSSAAIGAGPEAITF